MTRSTSVVVLGAGMVGTCTALQLAQRGHAVTLVDRREPGRETSYGNAGLIQREAVEPYAFPRQPLTLARIALKRGVDVNYHFSALAGLARPLARYWANSQPQRHAVISQAYTRLIEHSTLEHAPLIEQAGAADLVQRDGYLWVFRQAASLRQATQKAQALAQSYGLQHTALDSDELAAAEPALRIRLAGAIHWHDTWAVSDPGALVARYADLFVQAGGQLARGDAGSLNPTATGWQVRTDNGTLSAENAVVALGPWSDALLRQLGYRYPLFVKRGYHCHYLGGEAPRLALRDADCGMMLVPMKQGVRITTGAEFARLDATPTPVQLERALTLARELVDLPTAVEAEPWLGSRPCTADMLPVIGPAPRHRGLWFNLGHAHQGFTLGPVSGRLLAEMLEGQTPLVDPRPYAPSRFG